MNDDFNMEDELANSIAQIIDEETSEAEDMYRDKLDNLSLIHIFEPTRPY